MAMLTTLGQPFFRRLTGLRRLGAALALAAVWQLLSPPPGLAAAELVMFEESGCAWCATWNVEVGVIYHKTAEGRRAPLRRVDLTGPRPQDLPMVDAVIFSPTFVLIHEGAEIGRITGYPGEDFFWPMLEQLLARLDGSPEGCRAEQDKREGQEC